MERSAAGNSLLNLQNTQPLLSDYDKQTIEELGAEFDIDFINLAYTRTRCVPGTAQLPEFFCSILAVEELFRYFIDAGLDQQQKHTLAQAKCITCTGLA